ncbi:hypothetical protein ACKKBG_A30240 [Auxenochlorella protothecoides x Auxenochlorella symbiontica]
MTIGPRGPLRHLTLGSADWQELLGERTAGSFFSIPEEAPAGPPPSVPDAHLRHLTSDNVLDELLRANLSPTRSLGCEDGSGNLMAFLQEPSLTALLAGQMREWAAETEAQQGALPPPAPLPESVRDPGAAPAPLGPGGPRSASPESAPRSSSSGGRRLRTLQDTAEAIGLIPAASISPRSNSVTQLPAGPAVAVSMQGHAAHPLAAAEPGSLAQALAPAASPVVGHAAYLPAVGYSASSHLPAAGHLAPAYLSASEQSASGHLPAAGYSAPGHLPATGRAPSGHPPEGAPSPLLRTATGSMMVGGVPPHALSLTLADREGAVRRSRVLEGRVVGLPTRAGRAGGGAPGAPAASGPPRDPRALAATGDSSPRVDAPAQRPTPGAQDPAPRGHSGGPGMLRLTDYAPPPPEPLVPWGMGPLVSRWQRAPPPPSRVAKTRRAQSGSTERAPAEALSDRVAAAAAAAESTGSPAPPSPGQSARSVSLTQLVLAQAAGAAPAGGGQEPVGATAPSDVPRDPAAAAPPPRPEADDEAGWQVTVRPAVLKPAGPRPMRSLAPARTASPDQAGTSSSMDVDDPAPLSSPGLSSGVAVKQEAALLSFTQDWSYEASCRSLAQELGWSTASLDRWMGEVLGPQGDGRKRGRPRQARDVHLADGMVEPTTSEVLVRLMQDPANRLLPAEELRRRTRREKNKISAAVSRYKKSRRDQDLQDKIDKLQRQQGVLVHILQQGLTLPDSGGAAQDGAHAPLRHVNSF